MQPTKYISVKHRLVSDPKITISSSSDNIPLKVSGEGTHVSILCSVDAAAGEPRFTISYRTAMGDTFQAKMNTPELFNHYLFFNGLQRGDVSVTDGGHIMCVVTDKLGTYRATKHIGITGISLLVFCKILCTCCDRVCTTIMRIVETCWVGYS